MRLKVRLNVVGPLDTIVCKAETVHRARQVGYTGRLKCEPACTRGIAAWRTTCTTRAGGSGNEAVVNIPPRLHKGQDASRLIVVHAGFSARRDLSVCKAMEHPRLDGADKVDRPDLATKVRHRRCIRVDGIAGQVENKWNAVRRIGACPVGKEGIEHALVATCAIKL